MAMREELRVISRKFARFPSATIRDFTGKRLRQFEPIKRNRSDLHERILYGTSGMPARLIEIPVVFYRSASGVEPVREWLRSLPAGDRREIGNALATAQVGWPVGMPLCRSLGGGLWEVRSNLPSGRTARLLFFAHEGRLGVVHGLIKKTQKTPPDDLKLARKPMKEMTD
jgi:phage-related protein